MQMETLENRKALAEMAIFQWSTGDSIVQEMEMDDENYDKYQTLQTAYGFLIDEMVEHLPEIIAAALAERMSGLDWNWVVGE